MTEGVALLVFGSEAKDTLWGVGYGMYGFLRFRRFMRIESPIKKNRIG